MAHDLPRKALRMILVPKTMGLRFSPPSGYQKRKRRTEGGGEGLFLSQWFESNSSLREHPRNLWFFPNFFSAHFNKTWTLTRIIVQPRAVFVVRPIKYQHSKPGSRELTGNSWPEAYLWKIPNNFSDSELYYKTESNQICRLVAYFLSCKRQICVSLEFFPLPSKPSKSKFLAFGFFLPKLSASKT